MQESFEGSALVQLHYAELIWLKKGSKVLNKEDFCSQNCKLSIVLALVLKDQSAKAETTLLNLYAEAVWNELRINWQRRTILSVSTHRQDEVPSSSAGQQL